MAVAVVNNFKEGAREVQSACYIVPIVTYSDEKMCHYSFLSSKYFKRETSEPQRYIVEMHAFPLYDLDL